MDYAGSHSERIGTPVVCCPGNGRPAAPVPLRTVKALLLPAALRRVGREQHYYCTDADCAVVYFTAAGARYDAGDLGVTVADKLAGPRRLVCYCFGYAAVPALAADDAPDTATLAVIRAHVKAGRCACDVKNPSGRCCLSSLTPA